MDYHVSLCPRERMPLTEFRAALCRLRCSALSAAADVEFEGFDPDEFFELHDHVRTLCRALIWKRCHSTDRLLWSVIGSHFYEIVMGPVKLLPDISPTDYPFFTATLRDYLQHLLVRVNADQPDANMWNQLNSEMQVQVETVLAQIEAWQRLTP